jgi:hypothetical protein
MFNNFKSQKSKLKTQTLFFVFVFLFFQISVNAQCAMCRAVLAGEGNKGQAQAVNDGIVYLMVIPYILIGAIGYIIYRMKKNKSA